LNEGGACISISKSRHYMKGVSCGDFVIERIGRDSKNGCSSMAPEGRIRVRLEGEHFTPTMDPY
jgi:hypothetical protein